MNLTTTISTQLEAKRPRTPRKYYRVPVDVKAEQPITKRGPKPKTLQPIETQRPSTAWLSFPAPVKPARLATRPVLALMPATTPKALLESLKSRGIELALELENEGGAMVPRFTATGGMVTVEEWEKLRRWKPQIAELMRPR